VGLAITLKPSVDCKVHQTFVTHVHAERGGGGGIAVRRHRSRFRRQFLYYKSGSGTVEIRDCLFDFAAAIGGFFTVATSFQSEDFLTYVLAPNAALQ
jgi:hypothetical protein